MAYIKVDHAKLSQAAGRIDSYLSKHRSSMQRMRADVTSLSASWKGEDYDRLLKEWTEIEASDSTSGKMLSSVQNYADALRESASKYQDAQARAVNRANQLCK